jgi:hypothetical protein
VADGAASGGDRAAMEARDIAADRLAEETTRSVARGDASALRDIERITEMRDPVVRNLLITQRYYELSLGFHALFGGDDANWCTFATWASKTAGRTIREEDVPGLVRGSLRALDLMSAFIGEGNLKVFKELAPEFARFLGEFHREDPMDMNRIAAFVGRLPEGRPEDGGQSLLREAFTNYYRAIYEKDDAARSRLIFLGNVQIGLHEQTRLQPNIEDALNAPVIAWLGDQSAGDGGLGSNLASAFRHAETRLLVSLEQPGRADLPLGEDLPREQIAASPKALLDLGESPELAGLVRRFDRAMASGEGSAANDWASLGDRMNFIVNLFRSHHEDATLFAAPFSRSAVRAIDARALPVNEVL